MEKFERELNSLKEKYVNDQELILQISDQLNVLSDDKKSLIKLNSSLTSELDDLKPKRMKNNKTECKFTNSNYYVHS